MVNFLNLRYFVMIAEAKNITRIAENEHVSQQSLSAHIKKLENTLGVILFNRNSGFSLTPAGERFYKYAVQMLSTYNEMKKEMSDLSGETQGELHIGISYTRGSIILPELLPEFCKEYPMVQVSVNENNPRVLEDYLLRGHVDLIFARDLKEYDDIERVDLYKEKIFLIVPKEISSKILGSNETFIKQPARLSDFARCDFLLPNKGNRLRKNIDDLEKAENLNLSIALETEIIETLFVLACRGMGITVYNEMYLQKHKDLIESSDCPVSIVPLYGLQDDSIVSIGYNKRKYLPVAAKKFIDIAVGKLKYGL